MPTNTIQSTFAAGELSPSLYARTDLQKYSSGLKLAKNFIIHAAGGASNRAGTKYLAAVKTSADESRIIPFEFSSTQAYVLEFGNLYCRVYTNHARIMAAVLGWVAWASYGPGAHVSYRGKIYHYIPTGQSLSSPTPPDLDSYSWVVDATPPTTLNLILEIITPYTPADLIGLKYTQSADVLYLVHPNFPPKTLTRYSEGSWELLDCVFNGGPFMLSNSTAANQIKCKVTIWDSAVTYAVGDYVTHKDILYICDHISTNVEPTGSNSYYWPTRSSLPLIANFPAFNAGHVGAFWKLIFDVPGSSYKGNLLWVNDTSTPLKVIGSWKATTTGTWTGDVTIEMSSDNGGTWKVLQVVSSADDNNINTYGAVTEFTQIRLKFKARTSGSLSYNLSVDNFTQTTIFKINSYTDAQNVIATPCTPIIEDTYTENFAEGSWSEFRGWPSLVAFFQDRLIFAASRSEPQTEWMSKAGDYSDFGRSSPLLDSDGITINLPSRTLNKIQHLIGLSGIVALTTAAEWTLSPVNGVVSPTTIDVKCQGYRGSAAVVPVVIGNRVVYVQPMSTVVADLGYELNGNTFTGNNLSVYARHLFEGYSIIDMAYQQEPDSILWCVRSDGKLLSCTYMKEQEVLAWSWHETAGLVESICTIPGATQNEIYLIVNRGGTRFVEMLAERKRSTSYVDHFFVDCGLTYSGAAATVISGLDHLNGRTVAILADGNVEARQVVTSGQITLTTAATLVHVGLPYVSDLKTLNFNTNGSAGVSQGKKIKTSKVNVMLENSRGGWIGPDVDRLDACLPTAPDTYGAPAPFYDGYYEVNLDSTYEIDSNIFYRQSDPLPVTILALIPTITIGG